MAMQINNKQLNEFSLSTTMNKFVLINIDLKKERRTLYAIIEPIQNNGQWKMRDIFMNIDDIEKEFRIQISKTDLPRSSRLNNIFQSQLHQQTIIKNILLNESQSIIQSIPWHRIQVINRQHGIRRMTLHLSKEAFVRHLINRNVKRMKNNILLIPIVVFGVDNHWLEYLWIVRIDKYTDIGIAMVYRNNKIQVTAIHID
eukprot:261965_1